jgi:hypothetical protein
MQAAHQTVKNTLVSPVTEKQATIVQDKNRPVRNVEVSNLTMFKTVMK